MAESIVFLDRDTIGPGVEIRTPAFAHQWTEYPSSNPQQTAERLAEANIVITNKAPLNADVIGACPGLKLVAVSATGTNIVDIDACNRAGVAVCNVRGYAAATVAEHTFALILALRRNLFQYREEVLAGKWQESGQFCFFNRPIYDLAGATLGVIGTGSIASSVGALGAAFGMRVWYYSPSGRTLDDDREVVEYETLLAGADVVTCHCPLTDATYRLLNRDAFQRMQPTAIVINTARGDIVDEHALHDAIEQGQIAGAGIDVAPVEPPAIDSPLMRIAGYDNVILTPHSAWASVGAMQALVDQLIDNIEAFVAGRPVNLVTS